MRLQSRLVRLFAVVIALGVAIPALPRVAWANGEEFFHDDDGFDLYYFGHIKDKSGKALDGVTIIVTAKNLGMRFPVRNDAPGHFRSPDVGKAIKGLGKQVDPAQLEITVTKPGYKQVTPAKLTVPSKATGAVQVEFVMEPDAAAAK
jgi:hypothetical protein